MQHRRWGSTVILCLILAVTVGCAHRIGSTVPVSPWEKVMLVNAQFAQVLSDAELGTESLATVGTISNDQAKPFIKWESQVAQDHKPITAILKQGQAAALNNLSAIQAFVDQVEKSSQDLVASGAAGVKNPQTQQALGADIKAIAGLAQVLITDIQATKGVQ